MDVGGKVSERSAGTVILSLVPGEEKVGLVMNLRSRETKRIPADRVPLQKIKGNLIRVEPDGSGVVFFIQNSGFGTPFGKEEPEDENNAVATALRETKEETGSDVEGRLIESVSYMEQPDPNFRYTNIVFACNGLGFSFCRHKIADDGIHKNLTGFYQLNRLPKKERHSENNENRFAGLRHYGLYHAAARRIIAILLKLKPEHLKEFGRPGCENADDLARMAAFQIRYRQLFSSPMEKMLVSMKREDLLIDALRYEPYRKILNEEAVKRIGANLILWLDGQNLEAGLSALMAKCDHSILAAGGRKRLEKFFSERFSRKGGIVSSALDKIKFGGDFEGTEPVDSSESDPDLAPAESFVPFYRRVRHDNPDDKPRRVDHSADYAKFWLGEGPKPADAFGEEGENA